MALLESLRDNIVAESDEATWLQIADDLSDELVKVAITGDMTNFIEALTENESEYGINAAGVTNIQSNSNADVGTGGGSGGSGGGPVVQLLHGSGRWYVYSDRRWTTNSDDNYGTQYYQFNESCGTGAEPVIEWEHQGHYFPKGTKFKDLTFIGRTNNTQISDWEIRVIFRHPNPITRWETGVDSDSEDTVFTLFSGNFWEAGFSGGTNDTHKKLIDLGDFEAPEDGYVSIYVKGIGTNTSTRYILSNYMYRYE